MEKFKVSIEKQADGTYIAYNTNYDEATLVGTGGTVAEARADFMRSVEGVATALREEGKEVAPIYGEKPEFAFSLASLFEYYSMLNVSALARFLGMNPSLMRQYRKGGTYISDAQLGRIEDGLHRLGTELSSLRLV